MDTKAYWPNQWVFVLAAIGSAAGLGNIWRFPFLAFEHGGAAFVVAIIVANVLVGIPLLALEVGLGQKMQKGAADALGAVKRSFRYVGWSAILMGFMVLAYYMAVVGWSVSYFFSAFTLSWGVDPGSYFFESILQISPSVLEVGGFSWPVVAGFLLAWALVYFSVWKGVKSISKVVMVTATLPFVILFALIVRAVTLPGADEGLVLLFLPQWEALLSTELWLAAFSQVFFSLSLAFGIMIAYGSLKKRESELLKGVIWISIGNFLVSMMSAIVVFGTLGYMAFSSGTAVSEVVTGGPSLVFVVFPEALNLMPAFNEFIAVLFFGTILTLAIDSAFSLLEAVSVGIRDRLGHISTKKLSLIIAALGMLAGSVYTTKAGLYYLDIADHFIVNYGLVIIAILEAIIVGYLWKGDELKKFINEYSEIKFGMWWDISVKGIIPVLLTVFLVTNIVRELQAPYEGYPVTALIFIGVVPLVLVPFVGFFLDKLLKQKNEAQEQEIHLQP